MRVTQSIEAVRGQVRRNLVELAGVGLAALLVGLTAAWLIAGWLSRPLRSLARSARRVSGGELEHRAQVEGSTEQRELTEAFNDMTERLGRALTAQREFVANASHQLRTPLTGLTCASSQLPLGPRTPPCGATSKPPRPRPSASRRCSPTS